MSGGPRRLSSELALTGLERSLFDGLGACLLTPLNGWVDSRIPQPNEPPLEPPYPSERHRVICECEECRTDVNDIRPLIVGAMTLLAAPASIRREGGGSYRVDEGPNAARKRARDTMALLNNKTQKSTYPVGIP